MIRIRKAADRGHAQHGWLNTWHTFSFADYYDEAHMNFRSLRVLNEDYFAPAHGFPMHPHRDMEIVTYVLAGSLQHKDSMGNGSVIRAGEVQRMTAGTGILHSEFNPSPTAPVHLYQIWISPDRRGHTPGYEQRQVAPAPGRWQLIAAPDGRDGSATIHSDTSVSVAKLAAGTSLSYSLPRERYAWLQVLRGDVTLNGEQLAPSDGAAVSAETELVVAARSEAEVMLFDLA